MVVCRSNGNITWPTHRCKRRFFLPKTSVFGSCVAARISKNRANNQNTTVLAISSRNRKQNCVQNVALQLRPRMLLHDEKRQNISIPWYSIYCCLRSMSSLWQEGGIHTHIRASQRAQRVFNCLIAPARFEMEWPHPTLKYRQSAKLHNDIFYTVGI